MENFYEFLFLENLISEDFQKLTKKFLLRSSKIIKN